MNLTKYDIANALRADEDANWSANGALALASFLDENMPEDAILSVTDIRCEWSEYENLMDWADEYFGGNNRRAADALGLEIAMSGDEFEEEEWEVENAIREYIEGHGQILEFDFGIIVSSF